MSFNSHLVSAQKHREQVEVKQTCSHESGKTEPVEENESKNWAAF